MSTRTAKTVADIPELAAAWDYDQNPGMDPSTLKPGSHRTATWVCTVHGGYERRIDLQAKRVSCTFCLSANAGSSIAETYPMLAAELDSARNHPRRAEDIATNGTLPVWWICQEHGSYELAPFKRTTGPGGCPRCPKGEANVLKETTLAETRPDVARFWSTSLNEELTPGDVSPLSCRNIWWDCDNGHPAYRQAVVTRCSSPRCPECRKERRKSLGHAHPELVPEWATLLNGDLSPWSVSEYSELKAWWLCPEGHKPYLARIGNRTYCRSGCPECSVTKTAEAKTIPEPGSSLADRFPEVSRAWASDRNGVAADRVFPGSDSKAFWNCACGQVVERSINTVTRLGIARCYDCAMASRAATRAVPQPGRSVAEVYPELIADWDYKRNGSLTPADVAVMSKRPVHWSCSVCLARFLQSPVSRTTRLRRGKTLGNGVRPAEGERCKRCYRIAGSDQSSASMMSLAA